MKDPRKKASQTPLLVGRGYPQDMMVFFLKTHHVWYLYGFTFFFRSFFFPTPWEFLVSRLPFVVEVDYISKGQSVFRGVQVQHGIQTELFQGLKAQPKIPGGPRHQLKVRCQTPYV